MAVAKKKTLTVKKLTKVKGGGVITVPAVMRSEITFRILGVTPLIQHKWSEKAKEMIRQKQAGKKTKQRDAREPDAEFLAATHFTQDGEYGIPAMAIKNAIINAAHKDIGIEKTLVRKSIFMECRDENMCIPMKCSKPVMREDMVRIGNNQADLRYRPEFKDWEAEIRIVYDAGLLKPDDILNLVNRAGFGVGLCEWRPEKDGEYGRFKVDFDYNTKVTKDE